MIFETHAHYDDKAFDKDREEVLEKLPKEGIEYVVNISADIERVKDTIKLMDKYDYIYGAIGIHPDSVLELNEEKIKWLRDQALHPKCLAIGEIGLDYYWDEAPRDIQKKWFIRQIDLAKELELPIVIHSRDAAEDTFEILRQESQGLKGGVMHCYSYSLDQAREYVDMGFYLGIGGVVTFKNGRKLKEVVAGIPLENLVLETDSPYLSPEPFRGKRNTSLNIPNIAREIAEIKKVDYETVIKKTNENAKKLYFRKE